MSRPPVTTRFWIGDTVYRTLGSKNAGQVIAVTFIGDPAYPAVQYNVVWPKDCITEDHYEIELTKVKPTKTYS